MTQPGKKKYTAPFWLIIAIVLLRVSAVGVTVYYLYRLYYSYELPVFREYANRMVENMLMEDGTYMLVLIAEAIVYWRIRYSYIRKKYAWLHITGLAVTLFVLPALFSLIRKRLSLTHDEDDMIRLVGQVRMVLSVTLLIVTHLFFVLLLIDAHKKRKLIKEAEQSTQESTDILNDYAS